MSKFRPTDFFFDPCQNFMDPRQNSDPRHPHHFFDPHQNFMDPRHHVTHESTYPRYPRHPRYLADSLQYNMKQTMYFMTS